MNKKIELLFISTIILLANGNSLFMEFLYADDKGVYMQALNNTEITYGVRRIILTPSLHFLFAELSTYSIGLARFVMILLMIASAWLLNYLYKKVFKLDAEISLFAATLPFIASGQVTIPMYLMGSYPVRVLVLTLFTMFLITKLEEKNKLLNPINIGFCIFLIYLNTFSSTNPFIFMPFIFLVLMFEDVKTRFVLIGSIVVFAASKVINIFITPIVSQEINSLSFSEIIERVVKTFNYVSPFVFSNFYINTILGIILIGTSAFFVLTELFKNKKFTTVANYNLFILSFLFFSIVPYLFSNQFQSRHVFLFGIGISLLYCVSVSAIVKRISGSKSAFIVVLILMLTCLYNVQEKRKNVSAFFKAEMEIQNNLEKNLLRRTFPFNAQIVITIPDQHASITTGGRWQFSSGVFQHILKRKDVTGLIGKDFRWYDPFEIEKKHWGKDHRMNGLDISKPVFGYTYHGNKFFPIGYILRYGMNRKNKWQLLSLDLKTGETEVLENGVGKKAFSEYIELNKISKEFIFGL